MDLELSRPVSEHARASPVTVERDTRVEVMMIERADGRLRLARVAAIIAADRDAQARTRGLAA